LIIEIYQRNKESKKKFSGNLEIWGKNVRRSFVLTWFENSDVSLFPLSITPDTDTLCKFSSQVQFSLALNLHWVQGTLVVL
jgi:hypothetical protein